MKAAYVTTYDASDMHAWSGSGYYMLEALQRNGLQTESIGNLKQKNSLAILMKQILYKGVLSKRYIKDREPSVLHDYARQVENALASISCDVVFSPGTVPIACLKTEKPIVFWTDATFAGMIDFYPSFSNLCHETIRNGNRMERALLAKCCVAIYSSEWAANSAIQHYDVDPGKVRVVPFGANLDVSRTPQDIDRIVRSRDFRTLKLLFVGVDWHRKGGDTALAVAALLNQHGLATELHVVGCQVPASPPDFVRQYGFVSKKTREGRDLLDRLFSESHFFILPSQAECAGVVFAEASSFGLPSLATNVGGITTYVRDEKNGHTFPLKTDPRQYCETIEQLAASPAAYHALALTSFREYTERLNWSVAGQSVCEILHEQCAMPHAI